MEMPDTLRSYKDATGSVVVTDGDVAGQNFDLQPDKDTREAGSDDLPRTE